MMVVASEDVTYCTNDKCNKKCWRYHKNYRFAEHGLYWFMETCEKVKKDGNMERY